MQLHHHHRSLLFSFAALLLSVGIASAQNTTGTIVGHVADPSGAVVRGVQVTVTNTDTRDSRSAITNSNGDYTVSLLKPGNYQVGLSASGFKSVTQSGIVLNVDQTVRTDLFLTIGSTAESVNVSSTALALDTDSAGIGQLISGKQISDLPLNGRNFQDVMFLGPGAVNNPGGEQSIFRITVSGSNVSSVSLGGSRGSSEGYTLDGTTILDIGYDTPAFGPSLDDIDEFKEQTKSYSAAYGYSANQINISSKAGTNEYHGTVFEFLRNNYVDATPHGSIPGVSVSLLRRNQFGYALGGPVRIPWLYNGKNKTFFFANYEGFRQNINGGAGQTLVPTADELKGIFSPAILGNFTLAQAPAGTGYTQCGHTYKAGDAHPLFDPQTGCPFPLTSGNYQIPSGRISRLGQIAQRPGLYFPGAPNLSVPAGQNNFAYNAANTLSFDQQNYRIDQNIGAKDSIFFHAVVHDETLANGSVTPVSGQNSLQPARLYTLTETHIFTPNLTSQTRVGFLEALYKQGPQEAITSSDLTLLGWPNAYKIPGEGYPRLEFDPTALNDGLNYGGGAASFSSPSYSDDSIWDVAESAIYTVKKHTISFGFGGRRIHLNLDPGAGLGRISFNGQFSGDTVADLLLGVPSNLGLDQVGPLSSPVLGPSPHLHFTTWAPYVQDDWKVSQRLTLNLGLRYEYSAVPFEEQNLFIWPDFNAKGGAIYVANPQIVANYGGVNPIGGGSLYVNPPNGMRGPGPSQKNVWSPRVGFAYRVFGNDKTVVRGGYGRFFDTIEANEYQADTAFYPLSSAVTTTGVPLTYPPTYSSDNLPVATASGPVTSYATNPNSTLGFLQIQPGRTLNPYFESWNFGVERELPYRTMLEVDYVGNHGVHLFSRSNPNQPSQCIATNGCTVTVSTPASVPVRQRTPYQNLGTLIYGGFDGWSNYNALDVKVEHRSKDLTLLAAYTWSKELDTKSSVAGFTGDNAGWAGPQDSHNVAAEYARGNFDVGQRLAISGVYNLPIGRGEALLGNSPRLVDEVVGGWQVGTIASFQGGLPFTIIAEDVQGANNTFAERANHNPAPASFHKSLNQWFSYSPVPASTSAEYTQPLPGYYGNSARDAVRAPGQITCDLSMSKNFPIWDRTRFLFRVEAFNAFNHWNPGQPDSNINDNPQNVGVIYPNNSQNSARILQASARFSF